MLNVAMIMYNKYTVMQWIRQARVDMPVFDNRQDLKRPATHAAYSTQTCVQ